jgi:hypothetical protein
MPCCAVYGEASPESARRSADEINRGSRASGSSSVPPVQLGVPLERPLEPVLCLQEARVHAKSHRGSRRVRGGGATLWQRLGALTPYNPVWPGAFVRAAIVLPDLSDLVEDVLRLAYAPQDEFVREGLSDLQSTHSGRATNVVFVPLQQLSGPLPDPGDGSCCLRFDAAVPPLLPYCFFCSRKVVAAALVAAQGAPAAAGVAAAAGDPGAPVAGPLDSAAASGGQRDEALGYGAWLAAAFHEIVRTAAPVSSSSSAGGSGSARRTGGSGRLAAGGGTGGGMAGIGIAPIPRQCVPLGLCAACIDVVKRVPLHAVPAAPPSG